MNVIQGLEDNFVEKILMSVSCNLVKMEGLVRMASLAIPVIVQMNGLVSN